MKYTDEQIREANDRDIIHVAEELGMTLKRQGATVMALCPCHEDTHPSMQIGGRKNIAHCYVCGKTLSPVSLVMEVTGKNFKEAIRTLSGASATSPFQGEGGYNKHVGGKGIGSVHSNLALKGRGGACAGEGLEVSYFNMAYVDAHVSIDNALSKCLLQRFPREVVEKVTRMYKLGHDEGLLHYEHTWFPSIDQYGRCHNIKVQGYCTNPDVPQFAHSVKGQTMWLAAYLQKRGLLDKEARYETGGLFRAKTLFAHSGTSPFQGEGAVVLVESPKNAVVGACWTLTYRPELDVTWVAVGNKGMLKRSVLEPLRGRRVVVIPDRDAIDEWKKKISEMRDLATFVFSSFCDSDIEAENKKLDIADLMLSERMI